MSVPVRPGNKSSFIAMETTRVLNANTGPAGGKEIRLMQTEFFDICGMVHHDYASGEQAVTKECY